MAARSETPYRLKRRNRWRKAKKYALKLNRRENGGVSWRKRYQ